MIDMKKKKGCWRTLNEILKMNDKESIWCISDNGNVDFLTTVGDIRSTIGTVDWNGINFGIVTNSNENKETKSEENTKSQNKELDFDVYYDTLVAYVKPLFRWFDVDKVKTYQVSVWTKSTSNDDFGFHCFDITEDGVIYYSEKDFNECDMPVGAFPIIQKIKEQLKLRKRDWCI